jgi:hypothetical protein
MDEQRCNDKFALVINFLTLDWEPKLVTIGLFEAQGTSKVSFIGQLQVLFEEYKLINKIICYAKYEDTIYLYWLMILNRLLLVKN